MRVSLLSMEGALKETTHCAPNGYYFLPVYTQGHFLLRAEAPDQGLTFDPPTVSVIIDDTCHAVSQPGEDINFQLSGFRITGRIELPPSCTKLTDLSGITLHLVTKDNQILSHTQTDKEGRYQFENVSPGKYTLRAEHPKWTLAQVCFSYNIVVDSHRKQYH